MATVDQLSFDFPTVTDGSIRTITDVADVICGQHLLPHEQAETGMPYITGPADFTGRVAVPSRHAAVEKALCVPGDVLLTVKGSGLGKVNLAPSSPAVIGRQLFAIRPRQQELDSTFLWRVLQHSLSNLRNEVTSTTVPGIDRDTVRSLEIPVPALHEQRRIVARVEELATRIEQARGLRRQAVREVEIAVPSGARSLLQKVDTDVTGLKHWLDQAREGIQTGPFGAQLGASDFVDSGVPVLTIGNVQYSGIQLNDLKYVSTEKAKRLGRFRLKQGDILFARMGTIGRCCVVPAEAEDWLINYHIIRVALDLSRVEPRYIHWTIRTSADVEQYLAENIIGATRGGVNSSIVGGLPCRIPTIVEQRRIVEYLDHVEAKANAIKRLQAENAAELDALLPTVLGRAFRGEL